jgi:hypothetical protein
MDTQVESVVRKIERQLKDLSERNTAPVVKDKPAEEYLRGFAWDQFRYPPRAQYFLHQKDFFFIYIKYKLFHKTKNYYHHL